MDSFNEDTTVSLITYKVGEFSFVSRQKIFGSNLCKNGPSKKKSVTEGIIIEGINGSKSTVVCFDVILAKLESLPSSGGTTIERKHPPPLLSCNQKSPTLGGESRVRCPLPSLGHGERRGRRRRVDSRTLGFGYVNGDISRLRILVVSVNRFTITP